LTRESRIGKSFYRTTILVFAALLAVNYLPVFSGRIPFPEDLVTRHPAWDQRTERCCPSLLRRSAISSRRFIRTARWSLKPRRKEFHQLWNPYILGGTPLAAHSQAAPYLSA
jgi:hypothetical protein